MHAPLDQSIPQALRNQLERLGRDLAAGSVVATDVADAVRTVATLDGREIARLDAALRDGLGFRQSYGSFAPPYSPQTALRQLRHLPDLRFLLLFHGNGRVREVALRACADGLGSAFFLTAILYRLNDWAPQVRAAARDCASRVLPRTDGAFVAEAVMLLLDRLPHWYRWTLEPENRAVVDGAMTRPDVVAWLCERFRSGRSGRMGTLLRRALTWPGFDDALPSLAKDAFLPAVRAVALRMLLNGKATWVVGHGHEWVDKRYGLQRRVPIFAHRALTRPLPVERLLEQGALDRSGAVRRVAADGLVLHRRSLEGLDTLVAVLAVDRSASVRERIAFILAERAALAASPTPR